MEMSFWRLASIVYSSGSVVVDFHSVFKDLYKTSDLENYVKEALGLSDKNFQFGPFAIDGSSSSVKGLSFYHNWTSSNIVFFIHSELMFHKIIQTINNYY